MVDDYLGYIINQNKLDVRLLDIRIITYTEKHKKPS